LLLSYISTPLFYKLIAEGFALQPVQDNRSDSKPTNEAGGSLLTNACIMLSKKKKQFPHTDGYQSLVKVRTFLIFDIKTHFQALKILRLAIFS